MKHLFITVLALLFFVTLCFAQSSNRQRTNALSIELGKTGLIYNLNFDHKLKSKNLGFRFGAGSNLAQNLLLFSIGGGGYYLVGRKNQFFELGMDLQYLIVDEVSNDQRGIADSFFYPDYSIKTLYPSLNVGYRRYREKAMFRFGFSPGVIDREIIPGGYISYGIVF